MLNYFVYFLIMQKTNEIKAMLQSGYKAVPIAEIEDTIMNRILEIRDQLAKGQLSLEYISASMREPTLERILAEMDTDFMALRREVENAKAERDMLKAQAMQGADPMLDVLDFQIESAESAMQTRLIELKADKKLMKRALERLQQEDAWFKWTLERRKKMDEERRKMLQEEAHLKALQKDIERKKKDGWDFIYILIGLTALAWINRQRKRLAQNLLEMQQRAYEQQRVQSLG